MEYTAHTRDELFVVAGTILKELTPVQKRATLVTLSGELGAGKTALTQEIAKQLGVYTAVQSPTFVIQKSYRVDDDHFKTLVHIDAYRLTSFKDLEDIHIKETLSEPTNLVIIEWPECVPGLPQADVALRVTPQEDGERTISYEAE
ncbi:MAG: tRNA (adenosine(37)-N6)-threonylcarbamoyltransferase complex ATPase subunit type 1 TsaE [Candidatus Pacebacteria bacterium]|nr:tRNA (adenosine(37)-N6)-threonylcarbamoyltransferase complex ATPase subunit type 1 TsaE [Candidatus Paceibacterota bacterium]